MVKIVFLGFPVGYEGEENVMKRGDSAFIDRYKDREKTGPFIDGNSCRKQ